MDKKILHTTPEGAGTGDFMFIFYILNSRMSKICINSTHIGNRTNYLLNHPRKELI